MKTGAALFLSALLATLCGSFVDANGVCYDPDHTTGKNADSVAKDIATIKSKGFTYVRTYISKFGNTDMVKQIASSGLKVVAGVPYGQGDYTTQLEAAVAATSTGNVVYIMLGNENLANLNSVPGALIQAIKDLKARVPGVKVGTVQRNTEFLKNIDGLADLVAACDVIGVNIHPYFMGSQGTNGANAIETFKSQWNKIIGSSIPGIADKLFLGETGWPSDGSLGGNQGTVSGASAYFSAYKAWSASLPENKKFYFQLFDQPYKPEAYEKAYGLLTYDSQDKFGGASVPASTTAAPTTAPTPASTPAPTPTPAPTATPAASANSTSSSTGSSSSSGSSSKDLKSAGSGSAGSLATAGSESVASSSPSSSSPTESSETTTTQGETGAGAEITGVNGRTTVDTPFVDNSKYAGASGSTTETNTQSEGSGSSVGVAFGVAAGCAAVLGAFGFIYHTRKKAQELEEAESKMSFSVTPHGGCVL